MKMRAYIDIDDLSSCMYTSRWMHGDIKTASIQLLMNLIFTCGQLVLESVKD
jgi:hypothetical protein